MQRSIIPWNSVFVSLSPAFSKTGVWVWFYCLWRSPMQIVIFQTIVTPTSLFHTCRRYSEDAALARLSSAHRRPRADFLPLWRTKCSICGIWLSKRQLLWFRRSEFCGRHISAGFVRMKASRLDQTDAPESKKHGWKKLKTQKNSTIVSTHIRYGFFCGHIKLQKNILIPVVFARRQTLSFYLLMYLCQKVMKGWIRWNMFD